MRVQERFEDELEALASVLDGRQTRIWTALPGYVVSFNAQAMTAVVQPTIQGRVTDIDLTTGLPTTSFQNLPTLLDCPVQFPSGGGCSLTFPVKAGDEALIVFSSRCIDAWWQQSGVQPPMEARMHDLSDGFVILGFRSKPRALSSVSTSTAQLRSDDGQAIVDLNPTTHVVTVTAPGGLALNGNTKVTGTLEVTGKVTADAGLSVTGGATIDTLTTTGTTQLGGSSGGNYVQTTGGASTKVKAV